MAIFAILIDEDQAESLQDSISGYGGDLRMSVVELNAEIAQPQHRSDKLRRAPRAASGITDFYPARILAIFIREIRPDWINGTRTTQRSSIFRFPPTRTHLCPAIAKPGSA